MGESNRKHKRRKSFLEQHPRCIYCGAPATTTDHCPPRCFFEGRQWPETYEFPACQPCNSEARLDEQALAVLIRSKHVEGRSAESNNEWQRLVQGVKNNQPELLMEWLSVGASRRKRTLRDVCGSEGDQRRADGWGVVNLGQLSRAMIERFMIKMGKALFYKHNEKVFEGTIYADHLNFLSIDDPNAVLVDMLRFAPGLSESKRNNKSLIDQFIYRFNYTQDLGVLYAVVQFSEQFTFQLIVLSQEAEATLVEVGRANGMTLPTAGRFSCPLANPVLAA